MKLLEAIKVVTIDNLDLLNDILYCLEDRRDTVEMQEPSSDYEFFYEKWEEKFDSINDIYDSLENLVDKLNDENDLTDEEKEKLSNKLTDVINDIEDHQIEFGGLKRLKI